MTDPKAGRRSQNIVYLQETAKTSNFKQGFFEDGDLEKSHSYMGWELGHLVLTHVEKGYYTVRHIHGPVVIDHVPGGILEGKVSLIRLLKASSWAFGPQEIRNQIKTPMVQDLIDKLKKDPYFVQE